MENKQKVICIILSVSLVINLFFITQYVLSPKPQVRWGKLSYECQCLGKSYLSYPGSSDKDKTCIGVVYACEHKGGP